MATKIRNSTLVGSYNKQVQKYLPELIKLFKTEEYVFANDAFETMEYTKRHVQKLLAILKEMGWVKTTKRSGITHRKIYSLTEYGKQIMEENNNDSE